MAHSSSSTGISQTSVLVFVGIVATITNALVIGLRSPFSELQPDGCFYLAVAQAVAAGKGYIDPSNFWPEQPTMGRAPVWPIVIAAALKIAPFANPDFLVRMLAGICNVAVSLLLAQISLNLFRDKRAAYIAGFAYAVFPSPLYLASAGLSESMYILLVMLGLLLWLRQGRWRVASALFFGLACLVRSNFILFGCALPALLVAHTWYTNRTAVRPVLGAMILFTTLFMLPPSLWVARNYLVSGHFPVLSTIRGETFYGAYNSETVHSVDNWGYWVFPDDLPGETKKRELAKTYNEKELEQFYYDKGMAFLKSNPEQLPRLFLGRLIRTYVPIPWQPKLSLYGGALYRLLLYVTLIATFGIWRKKCPFDLGVFLVATMIVNLSTVLLFYGTPRFAFNAEPFFLIVMGIGVSVLLRQRVEKTSL